MIAPNFRRTFAATVALALTAATPTSLAQMVSFATPTPNQTLSPGEPFTVQLDSAVRVLVLPIP